MGISRDILTHVTILDISVILMYIFGIVALARNFQFAGPMFVRLFTLIGIIHLFFTFAYFFYSLENVADSIGYYRRVLYLFNSWWETFGQGAKFIYFSLYPLVKFIGLTYFGCFFLYAFSGLLGFYFLLNILIHLSGQNWNPWYYLLLLPSLHFWSVAIGKDSLIFLGISLLLYTYYFKKSWLNYIIPILIISFIRIHILFFLLVSFGIMQIFLNENLKFLHKVGIFLILSVIAYSLFPILLLRIGFVDSESIISQIEDLENVKAIGGTSIDMTDKNIFIKWISYLFRPLFYDAKNLMSILVSVENLLWIMIFVIIVGRFRKKLIKSLRNIYWFSFFSIFTLTIPASYIMYNLGIAVRQKVMIVPFLFVVFFLSLRPKTLKKNIYETN